MDQDRDRPIIMNNPAAAAIPPATSIHTERSVGELVKTRLTSELKDCDSLNPSTNRMMPPTSNAIPKGLFINWSGLKWAPSTDEANEQYDQCNDKQHVDKSSERIRSDEPQHPEHQQNRNYRP
jgi:hypothetical protein